MNIEKAKLKFGRGRAILKEQLRPYIDNKSDNTFNQKLSELIKEGVLKRYENGIYFFPHEQEHFTELVPSIFDIVNTKYLRNLSGIRAGAYLAYKFELTREPSPYYEIITNNISKSTRGKKELLGYVIVKASKFEINEDNIRELEFIELINNREYSDYEEDKTIEKLMKIYNENEFDADVLIKLSKYYGGNVNKGLGEVLKTIIERTKNNNIWI